MFSPNETVKLQKESKMTYHIPPWIPILVISFTIMEDMTPSFNGIIAAQTLEIFLREESQPILVNQSMIYYSYGHSHT